MQPRWQRTMKTNPNSLGIPQRHKTYTLLPSCALSKSNQDRRTISQNALLNLMLLSFARTKSSVLAAMIES